MAARARATCRTGPGCRCHPKLRRPRARVKRHHASRRPGGIRAWKRRYWIEYCFRTLKHLLATGACQVHSEDAYYGHLVLRLMGCLVLFYTSRIICKGQLTMEEIIFSLKHYWRFVDCEALELKTLS
jgi:hypothetical protein